MKRNIIIPVISLLLFYCNLSFPQVQQPEIIKINAPETLIKTSGLIKNLEGKYNNKLAQDIITRTGLICSKNIIDTSTTNVDTLFDEAVKINAPDNDLAVYSSINNEYMLEISFNELSFRLLNAIQRHIEELLNRLPAKEKLSYIPIFSTTSIDISKMKTLLVTRQIWILTASEKREEKFRCWLAVKRMLDEIDIPKSETGDPAVQQSPFGIRISSGEILKKLRLLSDNETDEDIRTYSAGFIKELESAPSKYKETLTEISINELENFNPFNRTVNEKALAVFNKALKSDDIRERISLYTGAIQIEPKFTAAYFNRGICSYEVEDYKAAAADFLKVQKLDPGYYAVYKFLGNCNYKEGRAGEAVKNFTEALKYDVTDTLFLCRGLCYQKLGQYRQAVSDYSSSIKLNPGILDAHRNRVKCYITLKQYDDAVKAYKKLIPLDPGNSTNYYNLGYIYSILKDWDNVIEIWEKGLQVNPNDGNILKNLPAAKANLNRKKEKK